MANRNCTARVLPACLLAAALIGCGESENKPASRAPRPETFGDYEVSQPYTHENLTLFMIYGEDTIEGDSFLTLQEALEQKALVVRETGNVSQLTVENNGDKPVYIQSGEIVRGGKQDRIFQHDLIVPPGGGEVPINSFCVERGRWSARGAESMRTFEDSANYAGDKEMLLAVKKAGDQSAVWDNASGYQAKLSSRLQQDVRSEASPSSLELTLSKEEVRQAAEAYSSKLRPLIDGGKNPVGLAVAVNGKIQSVDIYGSHALLRKLWPKLLRAAAVDAVVQNESGRDVPPIAAGEVKAFLQKASQGKASSKRLSDRTIVHEVDADGVINWQTVDDASGRPVHSNYVSE